MEVIESLAGMVSSMLDFPLVGYLGRLVPASGSEAGKQVRCLVVYQQLKFGDSCSFWPIHFVLPAPRTGQKSKTSSEEGKKDKRRSVLPQRVGVFGSVVGTNLVSDLALLLYCVHESMSLVGHTDPHAHHSQHTLPTHVFYILQLVLLAPDKCC